MIEANVAMHLRKTQQRLTQIMREKFDQYGLSFRLLHIAMLIDKNPNLNQKELSKMMKLTQGAISCSIKKLIELNMIDQVPLKQDMRYNRLVVTDNGKAIIDDCREHVHARYQSVFHNFTYDELVNFDRLLGKINANLDEINQQDTNI